MKPTAIIPLLGFLSFGILLSGIILACVHHTITFFALGILITAAADAALLTLSAFRICKRDMHL